MSQHRVAFGLSLAAALAAGFAGANPPEGKPAVPPAPTEIVDKKHADHGEGPHGGAVADWGGGKYHVEFTVDHDTKSTAVYVLGSDEKTAAPIEAKDGKILLSIKKPAFQVELKASPQAGDPSGASSRFVGKHDKLGIVQEFAGVISGEVDGTPYAGEFKEEPH